MKRSASFRCASAGRVAFFEVPRFLPVVRGLTYGGLGMADPMRTQRVEFLSIITVEIGTRAAHHPNQCRLRYVPCS